MTDTTNERSQRTERPLSPCILICTLDENRQCLGCLRTLAEIRDWSGMTVAEQWAVVDNLALRVADNNATIAAANGD